LSPQAKKFERPEKKRCDWNHIYTVSVRVRFGLIFLLCAALTFAVMVSFVLTILFSVILDDSTHDADWALRQTTPHLLPVCSN
jgi:hypothetical protein